MLCFKNRRVCVNGPQLTWTTGEPSQGAGPVSACIESVVAGLTWALPSACVQTLASIQRLSTALNILEKYGCNLTNPTRPKYWRTVKLNNPVFRSTVDAIQVSALHVLLEEVGPTQSAQDQEGVASNPGQDSQASSQWMV